MPKVAGCIRISSMKKSLIIVWIIASLVIVGVLVAGYLWHRGEAVKYADKLNRMDYSNYSKEQASAYLKEDVGLTIQEAIDKSPEDSGLKLFPQLYLVARVLGSHDEDGGRALEYFGKASSLLDGYHLKDSVKLDFYGRYLDLAFALKKSDLAKDLISKMEQAVTGSSLSDAEKEFRLGNIELMKKALDSSASQQTNSDKVVEDSDVER